MELVVESVAGGCINHCAVLTGPSGQLFVKTNSADKMPMFGGEELSLIALAKSQVVRVPEVFGSGVVGDYAYLSLEYLPMTKGTPKDYHLLGEQLAELHRLPMAELGLFAPGADGVAFGFACENFIGATPQKNSGRADWATFFAEQRIGYQLELAAAGGKGFAHGGKLVERIPDLLGGHEPEPSLLHGDLWGGNVGFALDGTPVVYDPACYFGDREADLAFSEMFGGFEPEFYSGYRSVYPLSDGYESRRDLYNLYHVLNHYNLFGRSYGEQAEAMIRQLLVGF